MIKTFLGANRQNKQTLKNTTPHRRLKNILNRFEQFSARKNILVLNLNKNQNKNNFMYLYFKVPKNSGFRSNVNTIYKKHKNILDAYLSQKLNKSYLLRRAQRKFRERYYTPPYGKGYLSAMTRYKMKNY